MSLARTFLSHYATFVALSPEVVIDTSSEEASAWQRAKRNMLASRLHDGSDPRIIAWEVALQYAYNNLYAEARLTWRGATRIDMRPVFREAIKVV